MLDWTQVEERIAEDDRNKWDRKAAAEELRIAPDGLLDVGITRFALSELATSQMCQRLVYRCCTITEHRCIGRNWTE